jgi:hypothetical protein
MLSEDDADSVAYVKAYPLLPIKKSIQESVREAVDDLLTVNLFDVFLFACSHANSRDRKLLISLDEVPPIKRRFQLPWRAGSSRDV